MKSVRTATYDPALHCHQTSKKDITILYTQPPRGVVAAEERKELNSSRKTEKA